MQTCVVHLIRQSLRYASRRDWAEVARDLKPVYTAVNEDQARERLDEFDAKWGHKYPSIAADLAAGLERVRALPGLPDAIREVVYTTNASSPSTPATAARPPPPADTSPTNRQPSRRLYLATLALDPTGRGRQRWNNQWKAALNEFDLLFDGRLTAGRV